MKKIFNFVIGYSLLVIFLAGCVSVPVKEAGLPTYRINGTAYIPLIALCNLRNIDWQYDTFTRAVTLSQGPHKINLMVGDDLVLVDGSPVHINHPVDIYAGTVVVPNKFKEEVLNILFKETYPTPKLALPLSKIRKIVIDAGHGGNDPGAIGRTGLKEKDVNLDIAKRLANLLRPEGVQVIMTRSADRFIPLSRRVDIANNSLADLFISIHSNANRVRSLNGFEVYYVALGVDDSKRAYAAAKDAELNLANVSLASNSLNLKAILWDMLYTQARAESIELSRSICRSMDDTKILGIKGARFQVLKGVRMPAVLVEVGFLSNSNEERMLRNSYSRQKIAEDIFQGIRDYAEALPAIKMSKQ